MKNKKVGQEIYQLIKKLYPLCRSISGNGVRQTLKIIKTHIPLKIHEVPSGKKVFDWTIPDEWNIKDAYIKNSKGKKIVDFKKSNLHVLNYSTPIHQKMPLKKLKKHLFSLSKYPTWIPYLTSYYKKNWGFCLSHNQLKKLKAGIYEVCIDSSLKKGHLTYGELHLKGQKKQEVLFSTYTCHPSLCNDNLSGVALLTFLAKKLLNKNLKYSYRFLFIPETIGAITWLSLNQTKLVNIKHGLVATCVGDPGKLTYKKTRDGEAVIDKVVEKVLIDSGEPYKVINFFPSGSDERQFCSPGFNLPIGSLMRTPYGQFPEQHSSADNLKFIGDNYLADSFEKYQQVIAILEKNATYLNLNPKGEPQLGKRGIYRMLGSQKTHDLDELAMFWVLNLSDKTNSLLDIAIRSQLTFDQIYNAAQILLSKKLLKKYGKV